MVCGFDDVRIDLDVGLADFDNFHMDGGFIYYLVSYRYFIKRLKELDHRIIRRSIF